MVYKYAEKTSYEFLSAGGVIRSYPGYTNFPVRLGNEIFNRCLQYAGNKSAVTLYDPLCGSGYLLTVLGLLNFDSIKKIYASDLDDKKLLVAAKNLRLLTIEGIAERFKELEKMYHIHQRPSYKKYLLLVERYQEIVLENKEIQVFRKDIFGLGKEPTMNPDIMMMDLPYEKMVNWTGSNTLSKLQEVLLSFARDETIIAIIRKKTQKLDFNKRFVRLEKFKVGHRVIEILTKRI
jgi:16S rRNA G966 N2-methylase RsmD